MKAGDLQRVEVASLDEWRAWLAANHGQAESIWLVTFEASSPDRYIPHDALVDEALAYGWIDSLPRSLDATRSMRRMSPRRPGSAWSRVNKLKVERLIAAGRMQPSGLESVARSQRDGSWVALDAVETLAVPPDLDAALSAHPPAAVNFAAFPRSSKRNILEWIAGARTAATRAARIARTAEMAARNLRANHARQPKGVSGST